MQWMHLVYKKMGLGISVIRRFDCMMGWGVVDPYVIKLRNLSFLGK